MALFTSETNFLELNNRMECTKEFAKTINMDYETLKKLRYRNWYLANGELYYAKDLIGDKEVLNYLLCEKIANTIYELQTSHFVLAKIENKIGLASLNFRHPNINYFYANQDYFPFWHPHETLVYLK